MYYCVCHLYCSQIGRVLPRREVYVLICLFAVQQVRTLKVSSPYVFVKKYTLYWIVHLPKSNVPLVSRATGVKLNYQENISFAMHRTIFFNKLYWHSLCNIDQDLSFYCIFWCLGSNLMFTIPFSERTCLFSFSPYLFPGLDSRLSFLVIFTTFVLF